MKSFKTSKLVGCSLRLITLIGVSSVPALSEGIFLDKQFSYTSGAVLIDNSKFEFNNDNSDSTSSKPDFPLTVNMFQDSVIMRKVEEDLLKVKELIGVSQEQEEELKSLLLDKYEYLKVPNTANSRTQLVLNSLFRRLEDSLDSQQIDVLKKSGLIKLWFQIEE
ncbi:hypothetical protein MM213_20250 [Belliella sp. R4-6]|uniref:Uncharacterized protein n=1 Tax=Belliella alkalica TaxID=1730871 RepID=A0ABS9VHC7_9BACT|nr:hypothetical protein [Belliella alkalica]MCH7415843.1 hypothetical protein [Belliella alkalica]